MSGIGKTAKRMTSGKFWKKEISRGLKGFIKPIREAMTPDNSAMEELMRQQQEQANQPPMPMPDEEELRRARRRAGGSSRGGRASTIMSGGGTGQGQGLGG